MNFLESNSLRPYLVRALHEWCSDSGMTPYLAVLVDGSVRVPREYVKDGEIVLNISFDATDHLQLSNEFVEFKARFAGRVHEISIPIHRVAAIYARESGQGLTFPVSDDASDSGLHQPAAATPHLQPVAASPQTTSPKKASVIHLVPTAGRHEDAACADGNDDDEHPSPPKPPGTRPVLRRVK